MRNLSWAGLVVAASALLTAFPAGAANSRPMIMGTHGVVVSGHHQASAAGLAMMQQGGNAIDAGVATVFAQTVLEFDRVGIGGEVPILIRLADENHVVAINGQGFAPQAATLEWFKEHNIEYIAGDGFLPATVPAVVESLILALDRFGTKSLGEVLAPAIAVADNGFPMYASFREHIEEYAERFRSEWPSSVKIFLPEGEVPEVGDVFVQKDLARTLKRLAAAEADALSKGASRSAALKAARDLFYDGEMTREIVRFQREFQSKDETGFESHGLFTEEDFASYHARVEEATKTTYRGIEFYKLGFWSQGPVLLQTLNILEGYDVKSLGHNSAAYIHLLSEAMKLAFADREWYYADPDFVGVPEQGLLSKDYAAERRKLIQLEAPSLELRPGNPYPFQPAPMAHAAIPDSIPFRPDQPGTTGTRVADAKGNVFSATPSGGWFYTSPILEGLGFVLGTRGQSFWLDPDKPNRIEPHKRPRTTLTPSLALKDGKPFLAWGTPGGDVQDQVNLQVFLNVVEFGMNVQQAVDAPLFQILDFPPSFYPRDAFPGAMRVETRIPEQVREELTNMGYEIRPAGEWSIGDGTALLVDPNRGVLFGAAGPRRDKSYALGW
jgi:gamma-glutamyltranspeptidase / glutathione hydrolase